MPGPEHEPNQESLTQRPWSRPVHDSAQLEALNKRAMAKFLGSYQGAICEVNKVFYNRSVIRFVKRSFMRTVLDWHNSTTLVRTQLKNAEMARNIEQSMLKKVAEIRVHFQGRHDQAKAVIDSTALDPSCITHPTRHEEKLVLLGPVSVQVLNTLVLCDRYLDLITLMYTMGEIDDKASNDAQYDVRKKLESLATSLRNHRIRALATLRDNGITREAYRGTGAAAAPGEQASNTDSKAQPDGNPESSDAEVVHLVPPGDLNQVMPEPATESQPLAAAA